MIKISVKHSIYAFSNQNKPIQNVKVGDTVLFETMDCFSCQVDSEHLLDSINWDKINPATGPVFVENCTVGDVLKATVLDISVNNSGIIATGKDFGVLGKKINGLHSMIVTVKNGKVHYSKTLKEKIKPMIGVMGVAPKEGSIGCGNPGSHGGNMDNAMIAKNVSVYFPVFTTGALFACGDLHALMGDGEIGVTGVEVAGKVKIRFDVVKNKKINNPILETEDAIYTVASDLSLDNAIEQSVKDMADQINANTKMPFHEIAMFLSVFGSAQICQIVDPLRTARFGVSKKHLKKIGFSLFQ